MFYSKVTGQQLAPTKELIMNRYWKVGDLAKLTGLTVRTLRFYDQIGLFSPSGQTGTGHRLYNEADLARLQQIVSLKELGLSLEEIKSVLAGEQISPLDIVTLQMARIKEQIELQRKLLVQLERVSRLMQGKAPLTVEDFTSLLQAMKMGHEKLIVERRMSWEHRLDLLVPIFHDTYRLIDSLKRTKPARSTPKPCYNLPIHSVETLIIIANFLQNPTISTKNSQK
jgi:DNA-binding transcriptional MerR regulator